ncbi:MAG TPA: hypothetical protein VFN94_07545, partial [Nitrospiria bacterium]|nr:hypothetical protein [Nitrospiria bacterium]
RRVYAGTDEKTALHKKIFLEAFDFDLFSINGVDLKRAAKALENGDDRACRDCGNRTAGRMATFSYRKAFSINQFQTIWDRAHAVLRDSDLWLFIGYSMPEADFEFRHLLKSAQLARREHSSWSCKVILKRDQPDQQNSLSEAAAQYRRFFGIDSAMIYRGGLSTWVQDQFDSFCSENGER